MTTLDDLLDSEMAGDVVELKRADFINADELNEDALTVALHDDTGRTLVVRCTIRGDGTGALVDVRAFRAGEPYAPHLLAIGDLVTVSLD